MGLSSLVDHSPILPVIHYSKIIVFVYFLHVSAKRVSTIRAKLFHSCLTLCDPMDYSLPGSPVHGILQARILEWVVMPSSRGSFQSRDSICISYIYLHWQRGSLSIVPPGKPYSRDSFMDTDRILHAVFHWIVCLH